MIIILLSKYKNKLKLSNFIKPNQNDKKIKYN